MFEAQILRNFFHIMNDDVIMLVESTVTSFGLRHRKDFLSKFREMPTISSVFKISLHTCKYPLGWEALKFSEKKLRQIQSIFFFGPTLKKKNEANSPAWI